MEGMFYERTRGFEASIAQNEGGKRGERVEDEGKQGEGGQLLAVPRPETALGRAEIFFVFGCHDDHPHPINDQKRAVAAKENRIAA